MHGPFLFFFHSYYLCQRYRISDWALKPNR